MNRATIHILLDTACWTGATLYLWLGGYPTYIAAAVGAFGIMYLMRAFRRYAQMLRVNRILQSGDEVDGQVYYFNLTDEEEKEFNKDPEGFMKNFIEQEIQGEGFDGTKWDVVVPEVEGNELDGWDVVDVRIQMTVEIDDVDDDSVILQALIDAGLAPDDALPEDYDVDGDAYSINIYSGWDGKPLFQLIRRYKE